MNLPMLGANLGAYSLQVALLLGMGMLLPALLGLKEPGTRLRLWHGLLAVTLLLPALQPWRVADGIGSGAALAGALTVEMLPSTAEVLPRLSLWQTVFLVLGAGIAIRLLWLGIGFRVLGSLSRGSRLLDPLPPAVERAKHRIGVEASFRISDRVGGPVTFGWKRPAVLIPPLFLSLPPESQECVACHELLHVKRRDWLYTLFEEAVRSLLWFHPAVWMLLRRIGLSREQAVDREVVKVTGRRRAYLKALYRLSSPHHNSAAVPALFFFSRSHLLQRMALLTKEVPMSRYRLIVTSVMMAGLLAITGLLGTAAFPLTQTAPDITPGLQTSFDESAPSPDPDSEAKPVAGKPEDDKPNKELKPKILKKTNPIYPDKAKKNKIEGVVLVEVTINREGKVVEARILESDHEILNQPTLDAIKQWEFEPIYLDEGVKHTTHTFTVKYKLS